MICSKCQTVFAVPSTGRLRILEAESGSLYAIGPEEPLHKCDSLTRDDELQLLGDLQSLVEMQDLMDDLSDHPEGG